MKTPTKIIAGSAAALLLTGAVAGTAIASDDSSDSHSKTAKTSQSAPASQTPGGQSADGQSTASQSNGAQPKVSQQQAEKTAQAKLPGWTVTETHLETENGVRVWEVDLKDPKNPGRDADADINASTGAVIKVDKDDSADANHRDDSGRDHEESGQDDSDHNRPGKDDSGDRDDD